MRVRMPMQEGEATRGCVRVGRSRPLAGHWSYGGVQRPKAILAGLLSMTTAGLLVPAVPASAGDADATVAELRAADDAPALAREAQPGDSGTGSGQETTASAEADGTRDGGGSPVAEADGSAGAVSAGQVDLGTPERAGGDEGDASGDETGDASGSTSSGMTAVGGEDDGGAGDAKNASRGEDGGGQGAGEADASGEDDGGVVDGPRDDSDDEGEHDGQVPSAELVNEPRLGDVPLIGGDDEGAAYFASGELSLAVRASELAEGRVELSADGVALDVRMTLRDGTDDVYDLRCDLADGTYRQLGMRVVGVTGDALELEFANVVVDTCAPEACVRYDGRVLDADASFDGVLYVARRPQVTIEIRDQNLDPSCVQVGGVTPAGWTQDEDVWSLELGEDVDLGMARCVTGRDLAGNELAPTWLVPVVVDDAAPEVDATPVVPDAIGVTDEDVSLFFAGGVEVRLDVRDECGIAEVLVDGADGCDVVRDEFCPGDTHTSLALVPHEGVGITSAVVVTARDLAGNWRTWSISAEGVASWGGVEERVGNAAVYVREDGAPVHPLLLLLDATAPVVEVRGVADGGAYAEARTATVSIEEASFSHLISCEGEAFCDQVVMTCVPDGAQVDADASEDSAGRDLTLRVRDFERDEATGRWEARVRVPGDGAYVLRAQLADVAGNVSAERVVRFVIDTVAPVCEVSFVNDDAHGERHEGDCYRTPRRAVVRVRERNWVRLRSLDVRYLDEAGATHAVDARDFADEGDGWHRAEVAFEEDGTYRLLADAVDVAGNYMLSYDSGAFVVDLTDPVIEVSYSGARARSGGYFDGARTATIRVTEHNFDEERFRIGTQGSVVPSGSAPRPSAWSVPDANKPDVHECTVAFEQDGCYRFEVAGSDRAGRMARRGGAEGFLDEFTIDLEAPEVRVGFVPSSYVEFEGIKYLNHAVEVPVSVRDRNLDAAATRLSFDGRSFVGDAACGWDVGDADSTGEVSRSRTVAFGHGRHASPSVVARDLAGNETRLAGEPFVVDLVAPHIVRVSTSARPSATYEVDEKGERAQLQFFGQATRMEFEVADEFGLDGVSLYDPDGQYELEADVVRGDATGRVVVALVEGAESHAKDAYERNIVLVVGDLAGNRHGWTLDRQGEVVADRAWTADEPTLNGEGLEPFALVQDTMAPRVAMDGVEAGSVSNQTQVLDVRVSEFNFGYLRQLRPSEVVVRVTSRDASPARSERIEEVPVARFEGEDPVWQWSHEFATDGHYEVEAQVTDVAGHPSNKVTLGEFTVDKTAPVIDVSWDHDMDEANYHGDAHYFRTTRHATVTVREHNFRAADVEVDAGEHGVVGAWRDNGDDTNTCVVSFDVEAKGCHLLVRATDAAGNVAVPYEQRDFVIDLTPPTVRIDGAVGAGGERAFAGSLEPRITFDDGGGSFNEGLGGWTYQLEGKRTQNVAGRGDFARFGQREESSASGALVTFVDLGQGADGAYDVGYDDVYTLTAQATDLAGNESEVARVTFSLNRFGSNFFVEDAQGFGAADMQDLREGDVVPLSSAPQIVVHEVNVSGELSELDHSVVRDYANAPTELVQDAPDARPADKDAGYSLHASSEASDYNDYPGWAEYVYTIRRGNFGEGAVEGGDGQGLYRVNVASVDAATNVNSTSRYWASDATREGAEDKGATVSFILDELPPHIDDLDLASGLTVGSEYVATFRVTDDISCGDAAEALVDGEPVEIFEVGSGREVAAGDVTSGTYGFVVGSRSFAPRSVVVRVSDYDGRVATISGSILVTTLVPEVALVLVLVGLGVVGHVAFARLRQAAEPAYPFAV